MGASTKKKQAAAPTAQTHLAFSLSLPPLRLLSQSPNGAGRELCRLPRGCVVRRRGRDERAAGARWLRRGPRGRAGPRAGGDGAPAAPRPAAAAAAGGGGGRRGGAAPDVRRVGGVPGGAGPRPPGGLRGGRRRARGQRRGRVGARGAAGADARWRWVRQQAEPRCRGAQPLREGGAAAIS